MTTRQTTRHIDDNEKASNYRIFSLQLALERVFQQAKRGWTAALTEEKEALARCPE